MTYLTLGQVNIPIGWLAFIIAIFYSDFRNRHADHTASKLLERLLYTYLIIWKLSYVLFSASDFLQSPLSLVYFDGGLKGHLLALAVIAFVLYKKRQVLVWEDGWNYGARLVAVFQLIFYSFQEQWFVVGLWFILIVVIERTKSQWTLLGQFFLLVWLEGFASIFTIFQGFVLVSVYLKTKQAQYLVITGLLSLVAIMLVDVENKVDPTKTERAEIDLPTTTGEQYRLTEQEQTLTVVNFFATWCPPCKAEMPHLQSFAQTLPTGVSIVGINLTARDDGEEALADFMDTYKVTYPILLDETDAVGTAFQVLSIPTTVLLNAQGEELERIVGPVSEDGLRQLIKKHASD